MSTQTTESRHTKDSEHELNQDLEKHDSTIQNQAPYSVFTKHQKVLIVFIATLAGFVSPLSSSIYFPALNTLADQYHTSSSLINLTITSYTIFQGISPTVIAGLSETFGRRPMYIVAYVLYIGANTGLALQNSYVALLVLRCLQSAGSSGTISLAFGVVADVSTSSERGTYVGWAASGFLIAPAIGPVVGGILAKFLGWRAIFWFLVAFSGLTLATIVVLYPETNRRLVGNGSIKPKYWNMSCTDIYRMRRLQDSAVVNDQEQLNGLASNGLVPWWQGLIGPFIVLKEIDITISILQNAFCVAIFLCIMASLPDIYNKHYGFNDLQIGLCFIPFGVASCLASILTGKVVDYNFRRTAKRLGYKTDQLKSGNLQDFPIERCRLDILWIPILLSVVCTVGYGWTLHYNTNLAGPLILLFIIGFLLTVNINVISTVLVDLYPTRSATVSAANNLIRCACSAGATAGIVPLINAIGVGSSYSLFAGLYLASTPLLFALMRLGPLGRNRRAKERK